MFCDLIKILLRIEFRTKGTLTVKASEWGLDTVARPHFEVLLWKQRLHRASRLHSEGMNAESSTTKSRFDERADFSARIASLPFIRNHGFARNDTKGAVFRAFPAFFKTFSRNAERENCKFEHRKCSFVFRNHFLNKLAISVGFFSLTTAREILGDETAYTPNRWRMSLSHSPLYLKKRGPATCHFTWSNSVASAERDHVFSLYVTCLSSTTVQTIPDGFCVDA